MISNREIHVVQAAFMCSDTQDSLTLQTSFAIWVLKQLLKHGYSLMADISKPVSLFSPEVSIILGKKKVI